MDTMKPWTHRCYILASPRTGSTLLAHWLNQSVGLTEDLPDDNDPMFRLTFGEHFNISSIHNQTAAAFLTLDPIVSKVHANWHTLWLKPWEMPRGVRLIHLTREDEESQARSLHHANATGIARLTTEEDAAKHRESLVEPTELEMSLAIDQVRDWKRAWYPYKNVAEYIEITYEQLTANPTLAVNGLLHWLDVPQRANCSPMPLVQLH